MRWRADAFTGCSASLTPLAQERWQIRRSRKEARAKSGLLQRPKQAIPGGGVRER
ncbi:MAG: hypothetical protein ACTFAL_00250 [Candidatus Electronema sp. V4]|uniref:hypothetical protein n=1 Tax=Candidatus Electronema sp. V4 TaxID=3454756 RepID=UPI0040553E89